ncbi:MAG: hypothetical protein AAB365_03690 [Patescibacteria group bacterium]
MDWSYTNTVNSVSTNGTSGEDILKKLFAVPFRYRVINPNDPVNSTAYLYDTNWNLLFYGYGSAIAKDISPTNNIKVGLWMQDIPVLNEVSEANVLVLNEDGQTADTVQVRIENGQLFWPSWLSGYTNTLLWVKYKDGTVMSYKVSNPIANSPGVTYEQDEYSIDGHYLLTTTEVGSATLKIMETWTLPTAYLDLTGKQHITIDVLGLIQDGGKPYFERPYSMVVESRVGNNIITATIDLDTAHPSTLVFSSGKHRIVKFNWSKFGQPQFLYTGGKG